MQIIFCHNKIMKIDLVRLEKEYNTMKSKEKEDEIELRVREHLGVGRSGVSFSETSSERKVRELVA